MALKCYKSVKKIRIFWLYARQRILRMATHNSIIPSSKLQVKYGVELPLPYRWLTLVLP